MRHSDHSDVGRGRILGPRATKERRHAPPVPARHRGAVALKILLVHAITPRATATGVPAEKSVRGHRAQPRHRPSGSFRTMELSGGRNTGGRIAARRRHAEKERAMHRTRTFAASLALGALLAAPALAQQAGPTPTPRNDATTTAGTETTPPAANLSGSLQKSHDQWRAGRVIGQTVYNDNGQSIGTIDELLMDDSGKVTQAVISVGGFLGIGSKLVAVPFEQLKFQQNQSAAGQSVPAAPSPNPVAVGGATPTPDTTMANGGPAGAPGGAAPPPPRPVTYYSVVMPGANKSTLTSTSEFRYAG
jgi:hypothetical protein